MPVQGIMCSVLCHSTKRPCHNNHHTWWKLELMGLKHFLKKLSVRLLHSTKKPILCTQIMSPESSCVRSWALAPPGQRGRLGVLHSWRNIFGGVGMSLLRREPLPEPLHKNFRVEQQWGGVPHGPWHPRVCSPSVCHLRKGLLCVSLPQ